MSTGNDFKNGEVDATVFPEEIPNARVDHDVETKKTKFNSSETVEISSSKEMASSTGIEDHQQQVLQNPIILRRIFTNFPTRSLLKRCSLVNKLWSKESRTLVRDHRKCSAYKPKSIVNDCEFLQKLDDLCCQISEDGRVIPFNSLKMETWWFKCKDLEESSGRKILQGDLKSELKIKYLGISWPEWGNAEGDGDCSFHHSLVAVIRLSAPHLKKFKLEWVAPQFENLLAGICFPQLEEIVIHWTCRDAERNLTGRNLLRTVLDSSPKCKSIRINDLETLYLAVPEEKYGLLTEVECCEEFYNHEFGDINLLGKVMENIIEKKPALRELRIDPPLNHFDYISDEESELDAEDDEDLVRDRRDVLMFKSTLQRLLEAFRQDLQTILIERRWRYVLEKLSIPSLPTLRKLILKNNIRYDREIQGPWASLVSVDFEELLPNLEELEINIETVDMKTSQAFLDEFNYVWPESDLIPNGFTYYKCSSVHKLTLGVQVTRIDFSRIKSFFPNVKSLELKMDFSYGLKSDCLPISEISRVWPDLEELNIHGKANFLGRNYDADFCGIHEEEAELLRSQDKGSLEAVHIVPVRPCLLTMSNLQLLRIALAFRWTATAGEDIDPDDQLVLKSDVSEIVAFGRMKQTDISVSWEIEDIIESDYGSDCDDADEDDDNEDGDEVEENNEDGEDEDEVEENNDDHSERGV